MCHIPNHDRSLGCPLFGYHYLHNILIVTASLSWITLGRCFYTMYQNYLCGYKDARFLNMANITRDYIEKKTGIKIHFMYELIVLAIILVYNVYMIYQGPIRVKYEFLQALFSVLRILSADAKTS